MKIIKWLRLMRSIATYPLWGNPESVFQSSVPREGESVSGESSRGPFLRSTSYELGSS
jgi:hypothetical protein